jgi:DNA-binding NarL/FixJ family response regulator
MRPRLLIADDHHLVVEGLTKLLEPDFDVAGIAHDGREFVALSQQLNPDIVILDISMPDLNGIEALRQIGAGPHSPKCVILTQQTDRAYVQAAFRAGAWAYVIKQSAAAELRHAIHEVLAGRFYVASSLQRSIGGPVDPTRNPSELFGQSLTPRQREVLQLVAEGRSAKEIALILHISAKTVEFHKASLMDHLGLRTTAELTRYAIQQGIISE